MYSMGDETVLLKCSESILTCQICMERFDSPRILPCQHTFCKDCVLSLIKKHCVDEAKTIVKSDFPCPNCRKSCKIRCKTLEEANLLKAFPENLLLNDLLEAEEAAAEQPRSTGGKKIVFGVATVEKIRDTLCRYQHIIVAIQNLIQMWPSREPRLCHPMQFCTDIRNKLSGFMLDLSEVANIEKFPKVGHRERNIRTILSRITEEERCISNTYTVDAMRGVAHEVADTPCCLDYIPILTPLMLSMRAAGAHRRSANRTGAGYDPRGGTSPEMPTRDAHSRDRRQNGLHANGPTEFGDAIKTLVVVCIGVLCWLIESWWST